MANLFKKNNWLPAIIVFAAPLYLIQIKSGWFSTNVLEVLIAGFFLLWLMEKKFKPSSEFKNSQFFWPVILIMVGAFASSVAANNPKAGLGILKSWFIVPALFAWMTADLISKKEEIKRILFFLVSSGLAVSLISLAYLFSHKLTFDGRLSAFYLSPNHLAMYLSPAFLISLVMGLFAKKDAEKIFLFAAAILMIAAIYFTFSYAAWLGIFIGMIVICFFSPFLKGGLGGIFLTLGIISLSFFLFLGNPQKFSNLINFDRSSLQSRVMIWQSAGLMIKDHPILGIGPGNFQAEYLDNQKYFKPYLEWAVPQPHNVFLAFWLQTGLIGLIGFIWLFIVLIKILWRKQKEPIALALLAVLIYILIHGLLDTPIWKNDLALIFFSLTALSCKANRLFD